MCHMIPHHSESRDEDVELGMAGERTAKGLFQPTILVYEEERPKLGSGWFCYFLLFQGLRGDWLPFVTTFLCAFRASQTPYSKSLLSFRVLVAVEND